MVIMFTACGNNAAAQAEDALRSEIASLRSEVAMIRSSIESIHHSQTALSSSETALLGQWLFDWEYEYTSGRHTSDRDRTYSIEFFSDGSALLQGRENPNRHDTIFIVVEWRAVDRNRIVLVSGHVPQAGLYYFSLTENSLTITDVSTWESQTFFRAHH